MPRYTDRYDALEAGQPLLRQSRKSSKKASKSNFLMILTVALLCIVVLVLASVVVVVVPAADSEIAAAQAEISATPVVSHVPIDLSKVAVRAAPAENRFVPGMVAPVDAKTVAANLGGRKGQTFGDNLWAVEKTYVEKAGRQREQLAWVPLKKVDSAARVFPARGPSPKDFVQSSHIGNCWLMAAASSLVRAMPEYLTRFSSAAGVSEKGLYTVNLFDPLAGEWTPITVDDKMPVDYAHTKKIAELDQIKGNLFGSSPTAKDAFYMMLIEKAIAQLKSRSGDYYSMAEGGSAELAWVMLTGQTASEEWTLAGNKAILNAASTDQIGTLVY